MPSESNAAVTNAASVKSARARNRYGEMVLHASINTGPLSAANQGRDSRRKHGLRFKRIAEPNLFLWSRSFVRRLLHNPILARFFANSDKITLPLKKLAERTAQNLALVREVVIQHVGFQRKGQEATET